jgi:hypothetical protein
MDLCPAFSVIRTNFDVVNYAPCAVTFCPGVVVVITMCTSDAYFTGDPIFRLFDDLGNQVAYNDDHDSTGPCGLGPQITYEAPTAATCFTYSLHVGCYGQSFCSGQVAGKLQKTKQKKAKQNKTNKQT